MGKYYILVRPETNPDEPEIVRLSEYAELEDYKREAKRLSTLSSSYYEVIKENIGSARGLGTCINGEYIPSTR